MSSVMTDDRVLLKHGAGGRAMRRLIEEAFLHAFETDPAEPAGYLGVAAMDDGGVVLAVDVEARRVAHQGKRLRGRLEGGIDTALGGRDTDEPHFTIG
jgi:hypothetical protein